MQAPDGSSPWDHQQFAGRESQSPGSVCSLCSRPVSGRAGVECDSTGQGISAQPHRPRQKQLQRWAVDQLFSTSTVKQSWVPAANYSSTYIVDSIALWLKFSFLSLTVFHVLSFSKYSIWNCIEPERLGRNLMQAFKAGWIPTPGISQGLGNWIKISAGPGQMAWSVCLYKLYSSLYSSRLLDSV